MQVYRGEGKPWSNTDNLQNINYSQPNLIAAERWCFMSFILLIYRPGRSRKLFYFENNLFLSLFHNISRTNVFDFLWLKIWLGKKSLYKIRAYLLWFAPCFILPGSFFMITSKKYHYDDFHLKDRWRKTNVLVAKIWGENNSDTDAMSAEVFLNWHHLEIYMVALLFFENK